MQEASDALSKTADSDTVSTYQVSSVQLVTDKKLELRPPGLFNAFVKEVIRRSHPYYLVVSFYFSSLTLSAHTLKLTINLCFADH